MHFVLFIVLQSGHKIPGGIILTFLTAAVWMASEHFQPAPPLYPSRRGAAARSDASNVYSQSFETVDHDNRALDEEDRRLCLLLEAFPGIRLETLAIAYARANKDPNIAAEILAAETRASDNNGFAQTSDYFENWHPPKLNHNPKPEKLVLEEEFCSFSDYNPKTFHSDDFNYKEGDVHQLKNGHGDFAGASVWRDSPILANHSRPPEVSCEPLVASGGHLLVKPYCPEDGNRGVSIPAQRGNNGSRSSKAIWGTKSSSAPAKLSAVSGSVTNQMQRRANGSSGSNGHGNGSNGHGNGFDLSAQREVDMDDGLYSGKIRRRKKISEEGKSGEDSGSGSIDRRMAAEDFLHSMFQGEFGIDLVGDVLAHYEGDTGKALETLLNIGSTSSGFDYRKDAATHVDPSFFSQGTNNEDIKQPHAFLQDTNGPGTDHALNREAFDEVLPEEDQSHILVVLCSEFPTVEQSFLSQVLQAAECSYDGALGILKESGLTPVGEQNSKPKLTPSEVLRALFRSESGAPIVAAGRCEETLVTTQTTEITEPWCKVAAKPRISRIPQVQTVAPKLNSYADGEYEYARHRASATEHWETMKMYMQEANAAYNKGDRARAGLLSEKGAKFKELASAASSRASQNIFNVRNRDIQNNITIDLHAQHVTEALKLLQLHLKTLSQIPSVHVLTVITGQGSHSAGGQAKIKPAVTRYLDKKQVPWIQKNPGCIMIKMSDVRSFDASQRDSESYSDSE